MHLLLTDRLTCPRCGPGFGLILLAERLEHRQVLEGVLGCPNCRDSFPVRGGFGDLRAPPRRDLQPGLAGPAVGELDADRREEAIRLAALLGIAEGPGTLALVGAPARHAAALVALLEDVHAVALDADLAVWPEMARVSRLVSSPGLPFFDHSLRGVVVDGRLGSAWLAESARVVAPLSHVVVVHAGEGAGRVLTDQGLRVLAEESETVVAARG
jgi:hypothetical protein